MLDAMKLELETPAKGWRDALPCGNGVLGALVHGRVAGERILFNHESLWSQGHTPPVPETADRLEELRTMLADGRFAEAEVFFPSLWKAAGFEAEPAHGLPGPDLCITAQPSHPFEDYRANLDMQTGEIVVGWRENGFECTRRTLVSKANGLAVVQLDTGNPDGLDVLLELKPHDPLDSLEYAGFGGVAAFGSETEVEDRLIRLNVRFADGTAYLAELVERFDDTALALAAYNMGPTLLRARLNQGFVPRGPYVRSVMQSWRAFDAQRGYDRDLVRRTQRRLAAG